MPDAVLLVRDLIEERTGLLFRDGQALNGMVSRLTPRLEKSGCRSLLEYYRLLSDGGTAAADEWLGVMAALSKVTSSFWRHRDLAQSLVDVLLPQWLSRGCDKPLRIWSAGCATGEEPLTIAMTLAEAGWFDRAPIEIHASDASFVAIERARRGIYTETRTRHLLPELRLKYFTLEQEGWQVAAELHNRIQWSVANLMDESEVAELAASDIIFCRNVFIYFSEEKIRQTIHLFAKRMPDRGYLFTDEGDFFTALVSDSGLFELQKINGRSLWMKRSSI